VLTGTLLLNLFPGSEDVLQFCGMNVVINSGATTLDSLITSLIGGEDPDCFQPPVEFGTFSWNWSPPSLNIKWETDDSEARRLELIIPASNVGETIEGQAFYYD